MCPSEAIKTAQSGSPDVVFD